MRNRLIAAAVLSLALTACGGSSQGGTDAGTSYIAGDGSTILLAKSQRGQPVSLAGTTLEGQPLVISDWVGSVVVINLWASWCGPCRSEAADLEQVNRQLAPQGVRFLGLNTRDGLAAAQAFQRRFPTGYPSIQDADGALTLVFGDLGPAATPTTLILDRQGRVAARILGPVEQAQLRDVVTAVLEEAQ